MKFYEKSKLREDTEYIKITSDFILNLYEKAKKLKSAEKDIIMSHITTFSQNLNMYIEKPNKISFLNK